MRRSDSRRGRLWESAMLSRKESATAELPADISTTSREMQTLVGVLRRIVVHDGSMTNTMMCQRAVACALLSRKAIVIVEHHANFRMMSSFELCFQKNANTVNHQDQRAMETEILGVGMMTEEQKIGTDTGMTGHLKDREVIGRRTMTDIIKEEKKDQKGANTMTWIASGQGTMRTVNTVKEESDGSIDVCT
ncbi:hypothetical protein HU200_018579 [Digitaria exilis]|uniref:Uncharacterized protein n=1 Tax=Digitaria exilis TaxID=1010633 RepID=A0A835KFS7_9POAL|nr:hypothetical protein HU200_018579 [Digitaria exilis]